MEANNSVVEYQELEKNFPSRARELRGIMQDKYNIVVPKECNEFLIRCLRTKDGSLEKAIKLLKAFFTATADFATWDAEMMPSLYHKFYNAGGVTPLKKRDAYGRRIFIIRPEMWDPSKMNFDEAIAALWMMAQFANAQFKDVQRQGFITVWDFRSFSLQQAWAVKQWRLISLAKWICNGVAGRIKAFHAINHPRAVSMLYSAIKPFLKEKLRKRVIFHDNYESLFKYVEAERLPTYLKGTLDPEECVDKQLVKDIIHADDFFQNMMKHRVPTE